MKFKLLLVALLSLSVAVAQDIECQDAIEPGPNCEEVTVECEAAPCQAASRSNSIETEKVLTSQESVIISVVGQGVAPMNTISPAQAYALAKRAAVADAYRLIAEKVKGVRVDGQDVIKDMMVKRSTVRTSVQAMVRNSNIVETTYKEGLCEVEMEIILYYSQFAQ